MIASMFVHPLSHLRLRLAPMGSDSSNRDSSDAKTVSAVAPTTAQLQGQHTLDQEGASNILLHQRSRADTKRKDKGVLASI